MIVSSFKGLKLFFPNIEVGLECRKSLKQAGGFCYRREKFRYIEYPFVMNGHPK